jgi:subtilisin family serine protease
VGRIGHLAVVLERQHRARLLHLELPRRLPQHSLFGGEIKPNIAAPGVAVRSSVPGNAYALMDGTSMASPHVAATVALIWSAVPSLKGDIETTRLILDNSAIDEHDDACGGTAADNNVWGEGHLDAFRAVSLALRLRPQG